MLQKSLTNCQRGEQVFLYQMKGGTTICCQILTVHGILKIVPVSLCALLCHAA